jgi:hypothetical protein
MRRDWVHAGGAALEHGHDEMIRTREEAVDASSGKYSDAFSSDYLVDLRRGWPD